MINVLKRLNIRGDTSLWAFDGCIEFTGSRCRENRQAYKTAHTVEIIEGGNSSAYKCVLTLITEIKTIYFSTKQKFEGPGRQRVEVPPALDLWDDLDSSLQR
jgi:hypothetical protein